MRPRSSRSRLVPLSLSLSLALLASAGCNEPRHVGAGPRSESPTAPSAADNAPPPEAPAPAPVPQEEEKPVSHGEILGRRTQDIRPAAPEQGKGAEVASTKITAKDPITLSGNAYVTMIGRTSILQIEHAMNLYKAANDRYPANFDEFKKEIIQANNIALPVLPSYQEYGYDEKEHKLVILEYPDRRALAHPGEQR